MNNRTHQQMKTTRGHPRNAPGFVRTRSGGSPAVVYEPADHVDDGCTVLGFGAAERPDWTHRLDWFEGHDSVQVFTVSNAIHRDRRPAKQGGAQSTTILDDPNGHVASADGVEYRVVDPGAICLVDSDDRIRQTWEGTSDASTIYESVRAHGTEATTRGTTGNTL